MKYYIVKSTQKLSLVAPVRERGLKYWVKVHYDVEGDGRSREGAWIEIMDNLQVSLASCVAPVRERGLKYIIIFGNLLHVGQSLP